MNTDRSVTTHMCRLSFCALFLEVTDDGLSVKITNHLFPKLGFGAKIDHVMTFQDAADLIYFVFHRDRLGPDLSALFFEWKEALELLSIYKRRLDTDADHPNSNRRLVQYLYVASQRYREHIASRCESAGHCTLFLALLNTAVAKSLVLS